MTNELDNNDSTAEPTADPIQAMAEAEHSGDDAALRDAVCRAAGLPVGLGDRLEGDGAAALLQDAREFAGALTQLEPPEPIVDFEGGARAPVPPGPPSMGSLIRAEQIRKQERRHEIAHDLDHQSR